MAFSIVAVLIFGSQFQNSFQSECSRELKTSKQTSKEKKTLRPLVLFTDIMTLP